MPKKKFAPNQEHGFIGDSKSKAKPKEYIQPQWLNDYLLERDRVIYRSADADTKQQILERYHETR